MGFEPTTFGTTIQVRLTTKPPRALKLLILGPRPVPRGAPKVASAGKVTGKVVDAACAQRASLTVRPLDYEPKSEATNGNTAPSIPYISENVVTPSYVAPPSDGHTGGHTELPIQRSLIRGPPDTCPSLKPVK